MKKMKKVFFGVLLLGLFALPATSQANPKPSADHRGFGVTHSHSNGASSSFHVNPVDRTATASHTTTGGTTYQATGGSSGVFVSVQIPIGSNKK